MGDEDVRGEWVKFQSDWGKPVLARLAMSLSGMQASGLAVGKRCVFLPSFWLGESGFLNHGYGNIFTPP
jgi:hypothetical protein